MSYHGSIARFFLVLAHIPLSGWTSLFIYSPPEGHLGCLQVSSIVNKIAINICVQDLAWM